MTEHLDIGIRMKQYEKCTNYILPPRIPVIIRIDGKSFHTFTKKKFGKNYNASFVHEMAEAAQWVMAEIQGCNFCYSQSDEISFLLTDYKTINTQGWFGYETNKLVSISAALASAYFSKIFGEAICFDSRAFSLPKDEVCNYFIWRQLDATRNAVQMAGREYFSHKQLYKKSCNDIQEMLFHQKGINFNNYSTIRKRGFCVVNKKVDVDIPIFTQDRNYIEKHVYLED